MCPFVALGGQTIAAMTGSVAHQYLNFGPFSHGLSHMISPLLLALVPLSAAQLCFRDGIPEAECLGKVPFGVAHRQVTHAHRACFEGQDLMQMLEYDVYMQITHTLSNIMWIAQKHSYTIAETSFVKSNSMWPL